MPSFAARAVAFILRTTGIYRRQFSGGPNFAKRQMKALAKPSEPSAKLRKTLIISQTQFQGQPVWDIAPRQGKPTANILYWHGGGYVYPPASAHWDFFGQMASQHGWRIVAPLYPLAPKSEVGTITGFALDLYRDFIAQQNGAPFIMAGDSAGGGLTAAIAMAARDAGLSLPQKLILISPWLDANPTHPDQVHIEPRDCILTIPGIREAGALYAGVAGVSDPRVSPLFGAWDGLPPILAFGGGDDILVTDARALKAKVPSINYDEQAGLMHDWPLFTFPESKVAQAKMADFALAV